MLHEKFKYKSFDKLIKKAEELNLQLPYSKDIDLLLQPISISGKQLPNRLVVQPMEGFDGEKDGTPGELTFRRYLRYAEGGSGMIWFEATSIAADGRSNPHQLMLNSETLEKFKILVDKTKTAAFKRFGNSHEPFIVLQLTHSGRYSKPDGITSGKVFNKNPYLDIKDEGIELYNDEEIDRIKDTYLKGIELAKLAGFDSVDIKACHGYLLHEMLSSFNRIDSMYGGNFENRTRLLKDLFNHNSNIINSIRLNATDLISYPFGFGMKKDNSSEIDLDETKNVIKDLTSINCSLINITAGIPKYNPQIGRPFDSPLRGSLIPYEHPLEGINRLIRITAELQMESPDTPFVGTAYSWLRQYFPNIGAGVIKNEMAKLIGLGRSSFAYPDAPMDLMENGQMDPEKTCISCSRCTELMRFGYNTGCVILDKEIYGKIYKKIKFRK